MSRSKEIIRTSVVGVVVNVLLAAFKTVVGLLSNSVAIVMDGVNNLSDALSSVITIVGTKLSMRNPDRQHPYGYGRVEYFSAIVIALIVLVAGVASLIESVEKCFDESKPDFTVSGILIIAVAVVVKLLLGLYVRRKGKVLESDSLIASGMDSLFDAVVTLSTVVAAIIMMVWGINLDGLFGVIISVIIIKAGAEMIMSPVSQLLGEAVPKSLYHDLQHSVQKEHPEVDGVYDMTLNYYGPNTIIGSMNVSVPDTLTAREIHGLTRTISTEILSEYNIYMNVGVYATYTGELAHLQEQVTKAVKAMPNVLYTHAFYVYDQSHEITLDVIPDDEVHDDGAFKDMVCRRLHEQFPDYDFLVVVDHNYVE